MIGHNRDDGKQVLTCVGGPFNGKWILTNLQGLSLRISLNGQTGRYTRIKQSLSWSVE